MDDKQSLYCGMETTVPMYNVIVIVTKDCEERIVEDNLSLENEL